MKTERLVTRFSQQLLSRSEVEALIECEPRPDIPVLSVYLDTDQSDAVNLKRAFGIVFKNMLRNLELPEEKNKQQELKDDTEVVLRFLDDYREPRRGLVVFCDPSDGFFWIRELAVKVGNLLRWQERPFVRPPLEFIDEHRRWAVRLLWKVRKPLDDLVQVAAERVLNLVGKVEQVRGSTADRLNEVGGVGAVLHY